MKDIFISLESFDIMDCKSILVFKNWKDYRWYISPVKKSTPRVFLTYEDYDYIDVNSVWMKCKIPQSVKR